MQETQVQLEAALARITALENENREIKVQLQGEKEEELVTQQQQYHR
jgi:hypothetical protein